MTPVERRLRAQIAVETSWANTKNRPARTRAARESAEARFVKQAREMHPDGSDELIAAVAGALRSAHYARMTLASLQSRANKNPKK